MNNQDLLSLAIQYTPLLVTVVIIIVLIIKIQKSNEVNEKLDKELALKQQELVHLKQQSNEFESEQLALSEMVKKLQNNLSELRAEYAVIAQQQIDERVHFNEK